MLVENEMQGRVGHATKASLSAPVDSVVVCTSSAGERECLETGISLPNNQRQHRTSHAPKDVLHLRMCANYCAPCKPLLRAVSAYPRGGLQILRLPQIMGGNVTKSVPARIGLKVSFHGAC